jgi:hypothetical protein
VRPGVLGGAGTAAGACVGVDDVAPPHPATPSAAPVPIIPSTKERRVGAARWRPMVTVPTRA